MENYHHRARLYISDQDNITSTTTLQNIWGRIPYPSTGITTIRDSGDFTIGVSDLTFTFTRTEPCWLDVEAICNIYKDGGANANRNVELVWHLNGSSVGPVRGVYMNASDSIIASGSGQVYIQESDVLEPMCRNIENDDGMIFKNCTFNFREDTDW